MSARPALRTRGERQPPARLPYRLRAPTGFESWGLPGPGRWITVYANAGHAWMEVAGWRFDTVALSGGGTRWSQGGGEFGGFTERHPPGL